MKFRLIEIASLSALCILASCSGGALMPQDLRCEHMIAPRVVDIPAPRLSWINEAGKSVKNEAQTAYRILVASDESLLEEGKADLWDSGKIASDQSTMVAYAGEALTSGANCYWKVRVWNAKGKPSRWSDTAYWGMGILDASLWKAEWIGAPWQGEETYKTVEPERPIPVPPGMSTEVFMKMVQQYMDNPQSNVFGRQEGESRAVGDPGGTKPHGRHPPRSIKQHRPRHLFSESVSPSPETSLPPRHLWSVSVITSSISMERKSVMRFLSPTKQTTLKDRLSDSTARPQIVCSEITVFSIRPSISPTCS